MAHIIGVSGLIKREYLALIVAVGLPLTACTEGTAPLDGTAQVAIKFAAHTGAGSGASGFGSSGFNSSGAAPGEVTITGQNGTLVITELALIVKEFELEPVEVADCDVEPQPVNCADFEARYLYVDVPLGDDLPLTVTDEAIPAGQYTEIELEVDDIEVDDGDPDEVDDAPMIEALFSRVRNDFHSDWPSHASMVVSGTFTPTGGTAVPFKTYFEAEIEIELEFEVPLVISDGARSVEIDLRPDLWFLNGADVTDLSQFDFANSGAVVEFELEMENGFEVDIDD